MPSPAIRVYLDRLRWRARLLRWGRDVLAALAGASVSAAVVSWLLGATPPLAATVLAWLVVAAATAAPVWARRRRDPALGGGAAAHLLGDRAPALVSAARTARELEGSVPPGASRTLAAAQRAQVLAELIAHPPSRVVPMRSFVARANVATAVLALLALAALSASPPLRAGFFALTHPPLSGERQRRVAAAVHVEAVRVTPPDYLGEPTQELGPTTRIPAVRGAVVELEVQTLARGVTSLELRFADGRTLPVPPLSPEGRSALRFLASGSTTARFVVHRGDETLEDAATLALEVAEDRPPTVRLTEPEADLEVDPSDLVVLAADAEDDHRLGQLEIVITTMDGLETRHPFAPTEALPRAANGLVPVLVSELGAEPGDTLQVHAEARDLDDVSGPHITRSAARTLRLRSEADRADDALATLEALREEALTLLADRIETPVPDDGVQDLEPATRRFDALAGATERLLDRLLDVANGALGETVRSTDEGVYQGLERSLSAALDRERRLYRPRLAPHEERAAADSGAIRELERAVLTLSSLLLRARADDAAAIARELESLRRQMASLLSELRRARTPEAMRELAATLARARQRVAELRARMARMGEGAPREFENLTEEDVERTEDALARMEEAVEGDDLDAAARALTGLVPEIDLLARALGQSQEAVAEERFGERERALADVIDRLMSLEAEQRELSARTSSAQRSAAERALGAEAERAQAAARQLVDDARRAADALGETPRGLSPSERDGWDTARARLRDAEVALGAGDLGEARRMALEASDVLSGMGRALDLDAMMFPGHDGQVGLAARSARDAERAARSLERAIEEAIPDLASHLEPAERAQLAADALRQASARQATSELEGRLERLPMGPSGAEIAAGLHEVAGRMENAEGRLAAADAASAAREQESAAQRLTEIRRQIEQEQQNGGGGGGDGSTDVSRETVVIPGAEAFQTPMEQRRRLLDAMGDPAPRGYDDAIRRYYEGLLR
ncbi:MAG: hypothetical protein ACK6CU_05370 [Deltaproteobacteria bacterium]